ncbi:MAG: ComEC/Rec2 family competence protein [Acidobacteria bacterium]|nr:ComEC/Rec2 family competence protein [Acidobacteriota bacterium]
MKGQSGVSQPSRGGFDWTRRPLWYGSWVFGAGIGFGSLQFVQATVFWIVGIVVAACLASGFGYLKSWSGLWWGSLVIAVFGVGALGAIQEKQAAVHPDQLAWILAQHQIDPTEAVKLTGVVEDWPEPAIQRLYLTMKVTEARFKDQIQPVQGRISVVYPLEKITFKQAWESHPIVPGTLVQLVVKLQWRSQCHNPGMLELDDFLSASNLTAIGRVQSIESILAPGTSQGWHIRIRMLRLRAINRLFEDFEPRVAGLLAALLFGSRAFLEAGWAESFRQTGTFHLLVISGSHLALLGWLVASATRRWFSPRWVSASVTLVMIWSYCWMVGSEPPVQRAAVAITVWQLCGLFFRQPEPLNVVGAASIALLLFKPSDLFSPSFQLTIGAVWLLVGGVMPLVSSLERIGNWRPTRQTPLPPVCPRWIRVLAEALFWSPQRFAEDMARSPITYQLEKSNAAFWLEQIGLPQFLRKRFPWAKVMNLQVLIRWGVVLLIASGMVQLALLPLSAAYFNRFTPIGLISNLGAELVLGLILILASGYFLSLVVHSGLTGWLVLALEWVTSGFVKLATWGAEWSWASWRIPHLEGRLIGVYVLYGVMVMVMIAILQHWKPLLQSPRPEPTFGKKYRVILGAFLVAIWGTLAVWIINPPRWWTAAPAGVLRVTFLDVGQGDSAVVEFPTGQVMLIDSGGWSAWTKPAESGFNPDRRGIGERVVSRALWARGIRRLDWIVGTHGDADHLQGFSEVVRNFPVGQALGSGSESSDRTYQTWQQALDTQHIQLIQLGAGYRWEVGAVQVEVLSPPDASKRFFQSDNDNSLVLRVSYGQQSFLFTGDIEKTAEHWLVSQSNLQSCTVLKAPHHGSKTSSTVEFLEHTRPQHVVFCAPEHSIYHHPHPDVVRRYQYLFPAAQLWQTGLNGAVTFETDGNWLQGRGFVGK